ncbi:50S ribosomal protein L15 [Actinopolyspora halophila]|uniref:50S ribosomal protein L15 n=1 Tax=Actinopolyspora halophila TaxID=1850 RepID=UPI00037C4ECE|nr:50S ribosomal protein L15 [Actinopolyspora halophila]
MVIKIHDLRPAPGSNRGKIRVGRGEASKGKTAGRGTKGTKARKTVAPGFEGGQMPLQMRLPKLRGFKNPSRVEYQGINVGKLAQAFPQGGTVGIDELIGVGLVKKGERIKVLGDGDLDGVKLDVTAHAFTGSAREKITSAGGSATKKTER